MTFFKCLNHTTEKVFEVVNVLSDFALKQLNSASKCITYSAEYTRIINSLVFSSSVPVFLVKAGFRSECKTTIKYYYSILKFKFINKNETFLTASRTCKKFE